MINFTKIFKKKHPYQDFYKSCRYPKKLILNENAKCLLLAPHADDESIGCGGLLLKHANKFDIICLTDGRYGDGGLSRTETINQRKIEFENVAQKLKINSYSFLNIEDSKLIENYDIFKQIDISYYDYIFLPGKYEFHPDHKAVFCLLQKLMKRKKHKKNLKLMFYEVWGALEKPTHYIDISEIFEDKKELVALYKTQSNKINYVNRIKGLNCYRGIYFNINYAECFQLYTKVI